MCDTYVSVVSRSEDSAVIFGKNSNREPNEAQVLEYHPSRSFSIKDKVNCTYITIPQVKRVNGVILSRPFWTWGAEMGVNEKGVVIGNEPVYTKMPYNRSSGLTGMDLLRLALERSDNADQALETIVALLSDYGQGGICGYNNKNMIYHNSFIIADQNKAWILETAGDLWAAIQVKDYYSISSGLTIGSEFDRCHPDLIETARSKGWLKNGKTFDFAKSFSDWFPTLISKAKERRSSTFSQASALLGKKDIDIAMNILRSHKDSPYNPVSHYFQDSVCRHAGNNLTRDSSTTGSMVVHLRKKDPVIWATGTSAPCTSIFKPIWFGEEVLPDLGPQPKSRFNAKSYWWYHERFHRIILKDFARLSQFEGERDNLQAAIIKQAYRMSPKGRYEFTCSAFRDARDLIKKWYKELRSIEVSNQKGYFFRRYWDKQNEQVKLSVP